MANYVPTMKKFYNETVAPEMMKEFTDYRTESSENKGS